jgi:hypothetical protein
MRLLNLMFTGDIFVKEGLIFMEGTKSILMCQVVNR